MGSIDRNAVYGKSQSLAVSDELLKYFLSSHLRGHITHLWRTSQLPLGGTAGFKNSFLFGWPWQISKPLGNESPRRKSSKIALGVGGVPPPPKRTFFGSAVPGAVL